MYKLILLLVLTAALTRAVPLISQNELPEPSKDIIDLSSYGIALFGKPDRELTAARVGNYSADTDDVNPEELGSYLEGDILIPQITMKNGIVTQTSRWPKAVVPYVIGGDFDSFELAVIQAAFEEYHSRTCIRFVPHSTEKDYILLTNDWSGCWSAVGRVGGQQKINMQTPGCFRRPGTVLHELMHVLGFMHEQSRKERDDYVAIQYRNIRLRAVRNFRKMSNTEAFGVPYDYGSVMHYSGRAFSVNGEPTIVARQAEGVFRMGQRIGFSDWDIEKLNKMYDCSTHEVSEPTTATEAPESTAVPENLTSATIDSSANQDTDRLQNTQWGREDGNKELGTS